MDKDNDILMDGIDERIEAFLRGQMSAEEESAFKQEIKASPELRNRALAMSSLIKELHTSNGEAEKRIIHPNTKDRIRPILGWACSIAAAFAIFFGIQIDKRYKVLANTLSPYYTQYTLDEVSRGDVDSAIVAHLYTLFNQIQTQRSTAKIIQELEPIYASLDTNYTYYLYANDISWNLALAYIKDDQIDKAIPILEKLRKDNPDTPICFKADELIAKIRLL